MLFKNRLCFAILKSKLNCFRVRWVISRRSRKVDLLPAFPALTKMQCLKKLWLCFAPFSRTLWKEIFPESCEGSRQRQIFLWILIASAFSCFAIVSESEDSYSRPPLCWLLKSRKKDTEWKIQYLGCPPEKSGFLGSEFSSIGIFLRSLKLGWQSDFGLEYGGCWFVLTWWLSWLSDISLHCFNRLLSSVQMLSFG